MDNEITAVANELKQWQSYWEHYRMPTWEEIPNFGLYMEQVIILMKEYLEYIPSGSKEDQVITAAAVNNYVRNKVMPEPQKKKYYRIHIAYLIMICSLKQSLSIAMLQKLIPVNISEEEVQRIYCAYTRQHAISAKFFLDEVHHLASPLLNDAKSQQAEANARDLITNIALISGFSKLLAERILRVDENASEGMNND